MEDKYNKLKNHTKLIDDVGLMSGKMGICIYFYISGKISRNLEYTKLADEILDEIYDKLPINNIRFDNGLIGIGCAIEYLVQNGYVKGDTNKILQDIDIKLLKHITVENGLNNLNFSDGSTGYLCYLIFRIKGQYKNRKYDSLSKLLNEMIVGIINSIETNLHVNSLSINRDVEFDLFATLPILIKLLNMCFELNIYKEKILIIFEQLLDFMLNSLPSLHTNRLYLIAVLLDFREISNLSKIDNTISLYLSSIDYDYVENEIDMKNFGLKRGLNGLKYILWRILSKLSHDNAYHSCVNKIYNSVVDKLLFDYSKSIENIGINNGVIGVELVDYFIEHKI